MLIIIMLAVSSGQEFESLKVWEGLNQVIKIERLLLTLLTFRLVLRCRGGQVYMEGEWDD